MTSMIDFMLILAICATATTCTAQCPYDSFTWVNNGQDNPYFWKSPSFDWNATATLAVFGDITSTPERIEMRDYAHSIGKNPDRFIFEDCDRVLVGITNATRVSQTPGEKLHQSGPEISGECPHQNRPRVHGL